MRLSNARSKATRSLRQLLQHRGAKRAHRDVRRPHRISSPNGTNRMCTEDHEDREEIILDGLPVEVPDCEVTSEAFRRKVPWMSACMSVNTGRAAAKKPWPNWLRSTAETSIVSIPGTMVTGGAKPARCAPWRRKYEFLPLNPPSAPNHKSSRSD